MILQPEDRRSILEGGPPPPPAHRGPQVRGKHCVIISDSHVVGLPLALLLLEYHATVTITHAETQDLPTIARHADVVVAATGVPDLVRADWVKPGAVVIDVGFTFAPDPVTKRVPASCTACGVGGAARATTARLFCSCWPPPPPPPAYDLVGVGPTAHGGRGLQTAVWGGEGRVCFCLPHDIVLYVCAAI